MNKRSQWELIKESAPDVAVLLSEMRKVFGRPAGVMVLLSSGVIVRSGCVSRFMEYDKRWAGEA
jgi:hypothetical protein